MSYDVITFLLVVLSQFLLYRHDVSVLKATNIVTILAVALSVKLLVINDNMQLMYYCTSNAVNKKVFR